MSIFIIDAKCDNCAHIFDILTDRATGMDWTALYDCPHCEAKASAGRIMSSPNLMKAALPDGIKRGGTYEVMKEAARLEIEAAEEGNPKRKAEIKKAIRETKRAAGREKISGNKSILK